MKKNILCFFILLFIWPTFLTFGQTCQVMTDEINKEYSGDCKGGLAHGNGQAKGDLYSYTGEFKKGYPDGEGTLQMEDGSVFKGNWSKGKVYGYGELTQPDGSLLKGYFKGNISGFRFMGDDKSSLSGYKVLETVRLENATFNFVKSEDLSNEVTIQIFENVIRQITNFEILEITSGTIQQVLNNSGRLTAEITNVSYPVTLGIRYILPYGSQDTQLPAGVDNLNSPRQLRFTITDPGNWTVTITHR